jgi:formamidopyrimidine-DNA glycosylase
MSTMPELPEVEAWRRRLDAFVRGARIERAGPAHVATLKTFDPPLSVLDGRWLAGAKRRGKHFLFPTEDGELVLHVHLMSAGRLRAVEPGGKEPKTPAFKLAFEGGATLILTEAGAKKRARVGLYRPEQIEAELAHLGPEAAGLGAARLAEILAAEPRRLHPLLRDQRALAGIGRAWSNEILQHAKLSPYALSTELTSEEVEHLADAIFASAASRIRRSTACTTGSGSRAMCAGRRSRASTSRSTRSTTARNARRPAAF